MTALSSSTRAAGFFSSVFALTFIVVAVVECMGDRKPEPEPEHPTPVIVVPERVCDSSGRNPPTTRALGATGDTRDLLNPAETTWVQRTWYDSTGAVCRVEPYGFTLTPPVRCCLNGQHVRVREDK